MNISNQNSDDKLINYPSCAYYVPGGINGQSFILESLPGSASLTMTSATNSFSILIDALFGSETKIIHKL